VLLLKIYNGKNTMASPRKLAFFVNGQLLDVFDDEALDLQMDHGRVAIRERSYRAEKMS